jgi:hypothetical protein
MFSYFQGVQNLIHYNIFTDLRVEKTMLEVAETVIFIDKTVCSVIILAKINLTIFN